MTKYTNWLGNKYVEPEKVPEVKPWSSVPHTKVPAPSAAQVELRELHRPASVPDGVEKNTDSVWAEFESVVPEKFTPSPESVMQDDGWVDTLTPSDFVDTLVPIGFVDTVRDEFDDL